MIDQNVIAGVLEDIAKKLREGALEVVEVKQSRQFRKDEVLGYLPTGRFSLSLSYDKKGDSNG